MDLSLVTLLIPDPGAVLLGSAVLGETLSRSQQAQNTFGGNAKRKAQARP